ncbi:MAG TPA: D-alanyl-D-alanine carboxypeptidase/D-alanyl-D-alanine-endopeptidase [Gemmatimonadaceae bacterium]|nr:D-alanyl-D-alanine carboxypeptidase/D-alanyl-D-alanine-endopeptidase [Gemmatimonadaceae bacterium]
MRRSLLLISALVAACGPAAAPPSPVLTPLESLRNSIDSLVNDAKFANAQLGLLIIDSKTGDTLYSRNAGKLFMPASNQKIITSAVALTQLGPDYRYHTVIAKRGVLKDSVLNGDLIVIGRGDPTMSDRVYGNAANEMLSIADSIRAHGIRHVTGSLRQGGNAFPDSIYGYGWEWDDIGGESGAPVDELLYNEGLVQRTVKVNGRDTVVSVATRTPGYVYLSALYGALTQRGITVDGLVNLTADSLTAAYDTVYIVTSPPLREILKHFMKPSQNQIGEALLKTIGLEKTGIGSADAGVEVETAQLRAWGVDSSQVVVYDGSGLSRHDLVSPETIVKVLTAMQKDTAFSVYYDAFPIAGVDGTIRSRMKGTPAENNLRGKTGTIEFVRSLSGYVDTADGERLVFSFLSNHFTTPVSEITRVQDAVGALLAGYRSKPAQ